MTRIVMTGADKYTGPQQPRAQLAPFQGYTFGDITGIEEGKSAKGNITLDMTITLREPGSEGINVRKVQAVTGEMGGKRAGVPNITGLFDVYFSAYTAAVDKKEAAKMVAEMADQEFDTVEAIEELKGKRVWFKLKTGIATNRTTGEQYQVSEVDSFLAREDFEREAESGTHHWNNPPPPSNSVHPEGANGVAAPDSGARGSRAEGRI